MDAVRIGDVAEDGALFEVQDLDVGAPRNVQAACVGIGTKVIPAPVTAERQCLEQLEGRGGSDNSACVSGLPMVGRACDDPKEERKGKMSERRFHRRLLAWFPWESMQNTPFHLCILTHQAGLKPKKSHSATESVGVADH